MRNHILLFGSALVLVVGSTYVHAVRTNRYGDPPNLAAAAAKLEAIPSAVGNWYSVPVEMPESQLQVAEAVGHFARRYRNDETQTEIEVLVLCGAQGPISVHSPTVCFIGAGYQQTEPEKRRSVDAGELKGEFWNALFTKQSSDGVREDLDTFWAWTVDGETKAPKNPRIEFAGDSHLYKIYVSERRNSSRSGSDKSAPKTRCEEFLKLFLPAFQAALAEAK